MRIAANAPADDSRDEGDDSAASWRPAPARRRGPRSRSRCVTRVATFAKASRPSSQSARRSGPANESPSVGRSRGRQIVDRQVARLAHRDSGEPLNAHGSRLPRTAVPGCIVDASAAPSSSRAHRTDERQVPVAGRVDDVTERQRRQHGCERRPGVHESACRARVPGGDVHRDCPHRPDDDLGEEERARQADRRRASDRASRKLAARTRNDPRNAHDARAGILPSGHRRSRQDRVADHAAKVVAANAC